MSEPILFKQMFNELRVGDFYPALYAAYILYDYMLMYGLSDCSLTVQLKVGAPSLHQLI